MEKRVQDLVQDHDKSENEKHERFQRLEDMIRGLNMIEMLSGIEKRGENVSVMNQGNGSRGEDEKRLCPLLHVGENSIFLFSQGRRHMAGVID